MLGLAPKNIVLPNLPLFLPTFFDANAGTQRRFSFLPQPDGGAIMTVGGDHAGNNVDDVFPVGGTVSLINITDVQTR